MGESETKLRQTVRWTRNRAIVGTIGCSLMFLGWAVNVLVTVNGAKSIISSLLIIGLLLGVLLYPHLKTIRLAGRPEDPRLNIDRWVNVRNTYRGCFQCMVVPFVAGSFFLIFYIVCLLKV